MMNYDRIILELLDRVSALEDEVALIKAEQARSNEQSEDDDSDDETALDEESSTSGRDTTKYLLDGKSYGKNRLVLATVQKYVQDHPGITAEDLMSTFDKSLQGSLGVIRRLDELKKSYPDYKRRFFTAKDEAIRTSTGVCIVCTQWGKFNIDRFVKRATQLGIEITEVQ